MFSNKMASALSAADANHVLAGWKRRKEVYVHKEPTCVSNSMRKSENICQVKRLAVHRTNCSPVAETRVIEAGWLHALASCILQNLLFWLYLKVYRFSVITSFLHVHRRYDKHSALEAKHFFSPFADDERDNKKKAKIKTKSLCTTATVECWVSSSKWLQWLSHHACCPGRWKTGGR